MSKKELLKRYIAFIIGLFFMALGIAVTRRGELGVSPISSVPNILSYKFTSVSLGNWLIIWNFVLIAAQIAILRKDFKPVQLLQIPLSVLFGYFTDIGMRCTSFVKADNYIMQLAMVFSGVAILGFGVSVTVIADVIMNSGEAVVKVISDKLKKDFGNVKIVFDISSVILSIILSLIFFNFRIVGTREGTVIAAFCTGMFVKLFLKLLKKPLNSRLKG